MTAVANVWAETLLLVAKMKNSSYNLAVCAVFGAIQLIFLLCAKYVDMITLTFYVLTSCAMMVPLTAKMYKEGILTYVAVSILAFFLIGIPDCFVYILFSGAYTIFTVFAYEKKLQAIIAYPIKILWANLVFYLFYIIFTGFIQIDLSQLGIADIPYYVFVIIVSVLVILYDLLMTYMYKYVCTLTDRIFRR